MHKKWVLKSEPNSEKVELISKKLNTNKVISSLLVQRKIDSFEIAKNFFRPSLEKLYFPFELKDMDVAIKRIIKAYEKNQKVLIYGDYDVDGTTAVAMVYDFLKNRGLNCYFYIPDRYSEGYGISEKGIYWAKEQKIDLIISLDCGIRANECVNLANTLNIDVIVCDHHEPGEILPEAYAIVNPKRKDCSYPFDGLSGCGVGFKLIQAIALTKKIELEEIYSYLDLVAISIAADIVPIVDENRILTYHGLKVLENNPRIGLKVLKEIVGLDNNISISQVVFQIAPRINAAGRINHAHQAVELLLSKDIEQAHELSQKIEENNFLRKSIDSDITSEAFQMIETEYPLDSRSTVLYKKDWHKGVLGIVASKCIEKYHRPTIIMAYSDSKVTGSVRSVHGYNVYEAVAACGDLLEKYGGHEYAAGLTLSIEKLELFKRKFEEIVNNTINPELLIPKQNIDIIISFDDIDWKMLNIINQMAPFGPGNMSPIFVSENLVAINYKIVKENHIKLYVQQEGVNQRFNAIGFNMANFEDIISHRKEFKMAYKIEENNYLGNKSISLDIKDIKPMCVE